MEVDSAVKNQEMAKVKINVDWDGNYGAAPADEHIACVVTAKTFEELKREMAEALRLHIEWMKEEGDDIPAEFTGAYELDFELTGRALVHCAETLVSRAALSKASGINERQLGHYSTGVSVPRPRQIERMREGLRTIIAQLSVLSL